jgi:hypothetical protein
LGISQKKRCQRKPQRLSQNLLKSLQSLLPLQETTLCRQEAQELEVKRPQNFKRKKTTRRPFQEPERSKRDKSLHQSSEDTTIEETCLLSLSTQAQATELLGKWTLVS